MTLQPQPNAFCSVCQWNMGYEDTPYSNPNTGPHWWFLILWATWTNLPVYKCTAEMQRDQEGIGILQKNQGIIPQSLHIEYLSKFS